MINLAVRNILKFSDDVLSKKCRTVEKIDDRILSICGSAGTSRGTGGMVTKVHAAQIACEVGIPTVVMNGSTPQDIYKLIDGRQTGTLFMPGDKIDNR